MDFALLQENGVGALPQFLTSLAIGLLIGLERERNPSAKAGLRTFALVAVFGTLSALLSDKLGTPWMLVAGMIAVAGMIVAAYINSPTEENDPGTTTVIALLLSYGLGAMIWYGLATLAVMLAIGITTLLYFKPELRGISQRLTRRDLVAVLQFSVLTFIVLPILPDQSYGPYGAFNPHQAWLMVVLISGLSLTGYAALQVVGTRYGAPLLGLFGGLASSTATTLIYSKHGKSNLAMQSLAASVIVIASMVVLVRLFVVSSVLAYGSLPALIPLFAGGLCAGLIVALYNWRKMSKATELYIPETANPAELHTAIGFGLLYVVVLLFTAWMADIAGSQGLYAVAFVSGLTDVDAIALSSLRLLNLGQLSEQQAVIAIAIGFLSNLAFKFGMVVFIGGWGLARQVAVGFAAISLGVLAGLVAL
ncbi:MAG: MgtC/SapB family protein [Gallionella sp.]|nr:MgtC/SapB family protein [Gallionella sp.]